MFILPDDPSAKWWPLVQDMHVARAWDEGTHLFNMPTSEPGVRYERGPTPFPVVALWDPPVPDTPRVMSVRHGMMEAIIDSGASHSI